ncbi:MAG: DUF4430 domain-containing protein [Methanocorpusculum sp.]|nr:DUF4430 domain-containing protein [Methanocorpusculum sp.]
MMTGKKCFLWVISVLIITSLAASAAAAAEFQVQSDSGAVVVSGDSLIFNIVPDAGFETVELFVDGTLAGSASNYSFSNITSVSHTLKAGFLGKPKISGSEIMMSGSTGTFCVNSSGSEFIEIDFGDSSEKTRYNATGGKIIVTHSYASAGNYNVTARALTKNKTAGSSVKINASVSSKEQPSVPVVNGTAINITNAGFNVTSITRFVVNESDSAGLPVYYAEEISSLPAEYGALPENKGVLAVVNITPVNLVSELSNMSEFTIRINKGMVSELCTDRDDIIVYRNTQLSDGSFVQIPLTTTYNSLFNTKTEYGYNVETPGYSYFTITAASETSGIAPADEVTNGSTLNPVNRVTPIPTQRTIYYTSINITPGSVEYKTTADNKAYVIDNMTVFGVLLASGKTLETKEWPGGIYINAIDGIAQDENLNGWLYQVNGEAPSVMSNNYDIKNGDRIVWYYSESMDSKPESSRYYFAFEVKEVTVTPTPTPTAAPVVMLTPAKSANVPITLPDGVSISSRGNVDTLKIDTVKTDRTGSVNLTKENSIVVIQPGLQITFAVSDIKKINSGATITAEIINTAVEILPAPKKVDVFGTVI